MPARNSVAVRPSESVESRVATPSSPPLAEAFESTLLEHALPYRELSLIARADQRATDPVYAAHRWWARRPPGVMRGLLLAAAMPATRRGLAEYWREFETPGRTVAGWRALDPFLGGGTTAVEAARLGAEPHGYDVDPLSVLIVRNELEPADHAELLNASTRLLAYLQDETGDLYDTSDPAWSPLHYFHLHVVRCRKCRTDSALYRSLIIARDVGKRGAVVRDTAITAFCPDCFRIRHIADPEQRGFRCCGRLHDLAKATYTGFRFHCPWCASTWLHGHIGTGVAPRRLIAIEETSPDEYRRIRAPTRADIQSEKRAQARLSQESTCIHLPTGTFRADRRDLRPISFGAKRPIDLFSPRQLLTFGYAFRWIREQRLSEPTRRSLILAVSNALTTNNKLCGYATDYGRLAPLFSVRSYSLPLLPVELNPFNSSGGRGTLGRSLAKSAAAISHTTTRYVWSTSRRRPVSKQLTFSPERNSANVLCTSAECPPNDANSAVDICIFDPPYFDFISYSELSEFYRAWLKSPDLGGIPLLPSQTHPVKSFGLRFARALRAALARLTPGRPLTFTYHSGRKEAWDAVGLALDHAGLRVTAIWPIRNDGHMGHHSSAGNCEWDVVVVCRRSAECTPRQMRARLGKWRERVRPLIIREADLQAMSMALEMAKSRFAVVRPHKT